MADSETHSWDPTGPTGLPHEKLITYFAGKGTFHATHIGWNLGYTGRQARETAKWRL